MKYHTYAHIYLKYIYIYIILKYIYIFNFLLNHLKTISRNHDTPDI